MNATRNFTVKSLRANKVRTLVTIAGVALAAALLTAVLTTFVSLNDYLYRSEAHLAGTWMSCVKADGSAELDEKIAAAHEVSPAQVILRWHIENGTIIIPKSVHADRQKENLNLFGFPLTADEHAAIDALDGPTRAGHDPLTFTYA